MNRNASIRRARLVILPCLLLAAWPLWGCLAAEPKPNTLSPEELADGWVLLFDGETTFGWKAAHQANWQVVDGALTASQGGPGLLCTTSQFGNYVLKVDFRAEKGANSGVFLRTVPDPTPSDVASSCYELNIAEGGTSQWPTGCLVERQRAEPVAEGTGWRSFEVTADGADFTVKLDGRPILQYTDPRPLGRGLIGLQFRQGKIEFRNVKLKPLGTKGLFNGKDLTGWKTFPETKSVFSVTPEGYLNVRSGRGQLETVGQYGDFTFQADVYVNGKALNSGFFFRSIPGDFTNGYECQIQNGFLDGDRTKPQDCGTGGIFRRQNARKVVADDFTWFSMTLHADGPHMAAWVNGYQVSDWIDTRPPQENPRNGLRLKAGTIQIQGHDPTTDLSLRNLRIADLPPR